MNFKSAFIKLSKLLLFLGFCYVMISSFLNLISEETGITQYNEKITDENQIPIPAFTILPFESTPRDSHFINISELPTVMKNGKEFPKWFKPTAPFEKLADENYLKSKFNLTWYQVWSIDAMFSSRKMGYFYQIVTFNPPKSYAPEILYVILFPIRVIHFYKNIAIDLISFDFRTFIFTSGTFSSNNETFSSDS